MPRRPRVHLDDVPLHIVQRGHNRDACFLGDDDFLTYLHWLGQALHETDCQLHAWVLMTNHVHLLVTPTRADAVPKLLISLGRRYVQHFNRTHQRTGTLWDSRYKSSLIHAEAYLLSCMRYIELNPVRAGMVTDPAHYRWSSYHHNGLGQEDARISSHPLYRALGGDAEQRQAAYRDLFRTHHDDGAIGDIRLALNQSQPLGNSGFHARIADLTGEPRRARPRGRPRKSAAESKSGPDAVQGSLDVTGKSTE